MQRKNLAAFGESGSVSISLAQDLVKTSAFWINHPQGIIHPEPAWAEHITKGSHGWEVRFGANKFLVERAIILSKRTILDEMDRSEKINADIDTKLLFRRLITCVRISVADYSDTILPYYTGGAAPKEKSAGYYMEESFIKSGILRTLNTERFGITPPSRDHWKGYMKFGTHAIKVETFVQRVLHLAN
ncbi:MAG: hypothetical protein KBH05_04565 [Nitrospira sp.]|jgi:hypothetical protein|nr:hypothetical protein [Nitrospira sp.]MBP8825730.1 hypothetical protein [Nitrospira sp.]